LNEAAQQKKALIYQQNQITVKENRTLQEVKRQQREQAVKEEQDINEKTKSYFPFTG
jgi:hypothetical protein